MQAPNPNCHNLGKPQIEEVVEFIESKLEELDAEKAELAAYQVGRAAAACLPGCCLLAFYHRLGGYVPLRML